MGLWTMTLSAMQCEKCAVKVLTQLRSVVLVLLVLTNQIMNTAAKTVFFNSYGDCSQREAFSLSHDDFEVRATGAREMHESLICDLTFKAPPNTGICLTFKHDFHVEDCGVTLRLYQQAFAHDKPWKKITCDDYRPQQMCTPERYVTLALFKRKLNNNRGYSFTISVEKSSNMTGEDVILASSIGLFVGIIGGVVGLIVLLAVLVLCCCCKPCKSANAAAQSAKESAACLGAAPPGQLPAVPTAPPVMEMEDERSPLQPGSTLYPTLPQQPCYPLDTYPEPGEQPPPYAPPPYEQHASVEQNYPTKV